MTEAMELTELEQQQTIIRDRVRGVALGYQNGFYLFGRGGTAKSYSVKTTLKEMGNKYHEVIGVLTPASLFDTIAENEDKVIILDDVSSIFKQPIAKQILLAALGNNSEQTKSRKVIYRTRKERSEAYFSGGIICMSNLELDANDPVLGALKSRINYMFYNPTDADIEYLIHKIASEDWISERGNIPAAECTMIADFLIAKSNELNVRLDIRNLCDKAYPDYIQWRNDEAEAHWKDLVINSLKEKVATLENTPTVETREATKQKEQIIARSLVKEYPDRESRVAKWMELTGKSEPAFYRRMKEIKN